MVDYMIVEFSIVNYELHKGLILHANYSAINHLLRDDTAIDTSFIDNLHANFVG